MKGELASPYALYGGAQDCERRVARFGDNESGFAEDLPIACLGITATAGRFGAELSHRDVLGAILGLGVERSVLGDIAVRKDTAFAFCLACVAGWLGENLAAVGRQKVRCNVLAQPPDGPLFTLVEQKLQTASERADAVIAKAYSLSREQSADLFTRERVFVDSAPCKNNSRMLKEGEIVSVRGFGRFVYSGIIGISKKGKLYISISKYS